MAGPPLTKVKKSPKGGQSQNEGDLKYEDNLEMNSTKYQKMQLYVLILSFLFD